MDKIIKTIEKQSQLLIIAIAVLMFILFALCPAIDIAGKAQASGLKLLFEGKGLGFSRFLSALILIVPLLVVANRFVDFKLSGKIRDNLNAICFGAGLVLCLILAAALPSGISLAWGGWLYIIIALSGIAVSRIDIFAKK